MKPEVIPTLQFLLCNFPIVEQVFDLSGQHSVAKSNSKRVEMAEELEFAQPVSDTFCKTGTHHQDPVLVVNLQRYSGEGNFRAKFHDSKVRKYFREGIHREIFP